MPRIAEETIQRVAEANDIVEVIGSYFPLKRAGTSYRALCPFHKEKSPSFHVNPQRQSYHCFGCGAGGTVFRFLMEYEHVDFASAVRRLAQRAGIPVVEEAGDAQEDQRYQLRRRLLALHADAAAWFHHQLLRSQDAQVARDYLKSRALTAEVAKSWQIGYAPDSWDATLQMLREKRYSEDEILQSGLASVKEDEETGRVQRVYSRFRNRVMFPICNDYGEVVAFSGRVLDAEARAAKYVNSPETPIFTKGRVLFGLHKSKRDMIEKDTAVVCEGQIDLISAFENGVRNVIAPQGTAFTAEQARLVKRFVNTVILCFDADRAGQEAVAKSLPSLLDCGVEVRVCRLPEGEDPDSLIHKEGVEGFQRRLDEAKNFFDHAVARMIETGAIDDPNQKSRATQRLAPFVAMIKDPVAREATAQRVCSRLGIAEPAFATFMKAPTAPATAPEAGEGQPRVEPIPLTEGIRQLCRLAILSPEVRAWLSAQTIPSLADLGDGGHLLARVAAAPQSLEEPSALAGFLASLPRAEELTLSTIDLERPPEHMLAVAQNSWFGLAIQALEAKQDAITSQTRRSDLSSEQKIALLPRQQELQKQILDLKSRVNEV